MAAGFWKVQGDDFLVATYSVTHKNYLLLASNRATLNLPIDGWDWSDDLEVTASELGFIWEAAQ
jgi:hypothetical protein